MSQNNHPAALCPTHGMFPATVIGMAPGVNLTIAGVSTSCPICGQISEILPGAYRSLKDGIDLLLDPSISAHTLAALRSIVEAASKQTISINEAKRQAEKIMPGSSRLFNGWSDQAKATLAAGILSAMAIIAAAKLSASTINVTIQPVIERIVPTPLKSGPLPGLPGGPPIKHKSKKSR